MVVVRTTPHYSCFSDGGAEAEKDILGKIRISLHRRRPLAQQITDDKFERSQEYFIHSSELLCLMGRDAEIQRCLMGSQVLCLRRRTELQPLLGLMQILRIDIKSVVSKLRVAACRVDKAFRDFPRLSASEVSC